MTLRCTVARLPDLGVSTYYDQSYPSTGEGLYAPDLATLEAAHPDWAHVGGDQSAFEPLPFYSSLPAPWGMPILGHGAVWQSDPAVQDFVTGKNWAGRWGWAPNFPGTVISARLDVECTDILEVVRFNGVDVWTGSTPITGGFGGGTVNPALVAHNGIDDNVVATYMQSAVAIPYAMVAWLLTLEVALVPGHWPLLRLTTPVGRMVQGRHHG